MSYEWGLNEGCFSEDERDRYFFGALEKVKELGFDGVFMSGLRYYTFFTASQIRRGVK